MRSLLTGLRLADVVSMATRRAHPQSVAGRRPSTHIAAAVVALMMLSAAVGAATEQRVTSPHLRDGRVTAQVPQAAGGGEVVLELTVDSDGSVARVERVRVTPPYADFVVNSVAQWRFTPATAVIEGRDTTVAAPVLIVAVFRPPLFYAGLAPGAPPQILGSPSARVPTVESVALPAYPPTAIGDGVVIVEIEMDSHAEARNYRIVGPASGFDGAALDAVRSWRFIAPQATDSPARMFVYALIGFRAPLTLPTHPPER